MGSLHVTSARRRSIGFWALAGVSLLISHDAIFFIQLGAGSDLAQALRTAGHDYWGAASALLLTVGLAAGLLGIRRVRSLRRRATALGVTPDVRGGYARRALRIWCALLPVVALGFMVQESVEHVIVHGHAIGIGALLGPEYPLAIPVIALITSIGAAVLGLIADAEVALLAAISSAFSSVRRAPTAARRRPATSVTASRQSVLSRPGAGRAPPVVFALER